MSTAAPQDPTAGVFIQLAPLKYDGKPPAPDPPCTDPTPDEQFRIALQERQIQLAAREQQQQQQQQNVPPSDAGQQGTAQQIASGATDMLNSLKSVVSQVALNVEKGASDVTGRTAIQVREMDHRNNTDRFRQHFPQLAEEGEILLGGYNCDAMHNGVRVSGNLSITRHYVCFSSQSMSSAIANATNTLLDAVVGKGSGQPPVNGIRHIIPFAQIVSIKKAVFLPTITQSGSPYFLPLPASNVLPTALQVYVEDGKKLYQFLDFDSFAAKAGSMMSTVEGGVVGTPLDRAYNYMDHAWRSCLTVPVEGVEYAS